MLGNGMYSHLFFMLSITFQFEMVTKSVIEMNVKNYSLNKKKWKRKEGVKLILTSVCLLT